MKYTKHKIEVFTAGCDLCKETMEMIRKTACSECTITEYNIREKCESEVCIRKAEEYGVKAVPTLIIDGKITIEGKPTISQIKEALKL